jgi:hypothetical protein
MTKQEFWASERGKQLASEYIGAKAEFCAALNDPQNAPAPISTYRAAFAQVCERIGYAMANVDKRMSKFHLDLAASYGLSR